jgi:hypothetical protein
MCDAGFGWRQECAACIYSCITYAWRLVGAAASANARGQKTFLLNLHRYIDTQGRGVHGPDERGLERLFTHNVKLYNCAVGLVRNNPELQYEA